MLYLMSATIIPHESDGKWIMHTLDLETASAVAKTQHWTSAIGHESSAQAMSIALGVQCQANRITVKPKRGDSFLCLRLHGRPPEGVVLDIEQLQKIGFSFALLIYVGLPLKVEWVLSPKYIETCSLLKISDKVTPYQVASALWADGIRTHDEWGEIGFNPTTSLMQLLDSINSATDEAN